MDVKLYHQCALKCHIYITCVSCDTAGSPGGRAGLVPGISNKLHQARLALLICELLWTARVWNSGGPNSSHGSAMQSMKSCQESVRNALTHTMMPRPGGQIRAWGECRISLQLYPKWFTKWCGWPSSISTRGLWWRRWGWPPENTEGWLNSHQCPCPSHAFL